MGKKVSVDIVEYSSFGKLVVPINVRSWLLFLLTKLFQGLLNSSTMENTNVMMW